MDPVESPVSKGLSSVSRPVIGWREWVSLPLLQVPAIKAKIDTGARSSALHAFNVEIVERDGQQLVEFEVHPLQRDNRTSIRTQAPLLEFRHVTSSGGHRTRRPVILTQIELPGQIWEIELTLASRDAMGFRMLLGRQGVRRRFLVDPGRSYVMSERQGKRRRRRRQNRP